MTSTKPEKRQQPQLGKRFPSEHRSYCSPNSINGNVDGEHWQSTEIWWLNPSTVFFSGFIPPLIGSMAAIVIALIFHNDQISNYNWQCGRATLPSLSRIINLRLERTFWQLFLLLHAPMRILECFTGFYRYGRLMNVHFRYKRFYNLSRYCYFYIGVAEVLLLCGLSIIGERENIQAHVILFYSFGFAGIGFFISNAICHRQSLYYLNPYGRISFNLKVLLAILYILSVPILLGSFALYWKKCLTFAYDIFAICEYVGVFLNIAYHGCAWLDIRHKVRFSLRVVHKLEKPTLSSLTLNERKMAMIRFNSPRPEYLRSRTM